MSVAAAKLLTEIMSPTVENIKSVEVKWIVYFERLRLKTSLRARNHQMIMQIIKSSSEKILDPSFNTVPVFIRQWEIQTHLPRHVLLICDIRRNYFPLRN